MAISLNQHVRELNTMIMKGQLMEAFDKFYAEDVVMQENENPPVIGKKANREREEKLVSGPVGKAVRTLKASLAEGDSAMNEWVIEMEGEDGKTIKMSEVSVQKWKDGKIISEKFYYGS
jgi:ketosteroid isomerase-like protein